VERDLIISAAVSLADEAGADALSMRALAQRLDSGTATLYRHFGNRTELVANVVDRVLGEVDLDAQELRRVNWRDACARIAHSMFYALSRHLNICPLLVGEIPMGPNAMRLREYTIAALLDNGFSSKLAARSWATLGRFVVGFAMQARGHGAAVGIKDPRFHSMFRDLDATQFPATARVAKSLPVSLEDEFTFGLDLILDGLSQMSQGKARVRGTRLRTAG